MIDHRVMPANHEEAYQLACLKRESNLARAYIELRAQLAQAEPVATVQFGSAHQCHISQWIGEPLIVGTKLYINRLAQCRSGWQPIKTAPQDGTCILVGNRYGAWVAKYMPVYPSGFRPSSPWFCMMLNREYMTVLGDLPTHWMPLPPAPERGDTP